MVGAMYKHIIRNSKYKDGRLILSNNEEEIFFNSEGVNA